VHALPCSSDA